MSQLRPDHPQLASLNQALQAKREQVANEARQKIESDNRRQAAEEAKRRAAEEAKRRSLGRVYPRTDTRETTRKFGLETRDSAATETSQTRIRTRWPASPEEARSTGCREALLKAQLGEPLSTTEQEACRP
ncbi:MAG: hypothetical protein M0C28_06660 [Candidatus Moduliflexus flocculans]|nr:hypothetical protein [Candidatus Moduliflexus flocculans]